MGPWYTIGLCLGLGLGIGVALAGVLGSNVLGVGVGALVGAAAGAALGFAIGDTAEVVAGGVGGFLGAIAAAGGGPRAPAAEGGPLPIGQGQTISQPFIVATICELLALDGHERVLDVGTGSGYQAAVLAELAAEGVTIERVPGLAARARAALESAGYDRVEVRVGDGSLGVPDRGPFSAIAIAAASPTVPHALYLQLEEAARLAVPRGP